MTTDLPIFPPKIRRGDTLGLLMAASPVREPGALEAGMRLIEEMGFRVRLEPCGPAPCDYLAGEDRARLHSLYRLWQDPEVKAVVAVRGGFGCLRLLADLDPSLLRQMPKRLIGFSDLTVLLNTLWTKSGVVSLHGPVLTSLAKIDQESRDHFFTLLTGDPSEIDLRREVEVLRPGRGRGRLAGGNLATLTSLLGTDHAVPTAGTILLLEDTGEVLYKVDRMLSQLALTGCLDRLGGLLLGSFDIGTTLNADQQRLQEGVWNRALQLVDGFDFPVWGNVPCGHLGRNLSLAIGMEYTMDSSNCTLHPNPSSVVWAD